MVPPFPGRPVFCLSGGRLSVTPSGTRHTNSPVFTFTAVNCPQGGCWHGSCCESLPGTLKRPPPGTPSYGPSGSTRLPMPVAIGPARLRIMILHARKLPQFIGVDEQIAQLRIERSPAPVHAAMVAGELHAQAVVADRKVGSAHLHAFDQLLARLFQLRGNRRDVRRAASSCAPAVAV